MRDKTGVNDDVHGSHYRCGSGAGASRFLVGLVTCFAAGDGIPLVARAVLLAEAGAEGAQRRAADREAVRTFREPSENPFPRR